MNRYEKAFRFVMNGLPKWKRDAVQEDLAEGKTSSFVQSFVDEVIKLAESRTPISVPKAVPQYNFNEKAATLPEDIPPWQTTNGANGDDENYF